MLDIYILRINLPNGALKYLINGLFINENNG